MAINLLILPFKESQSGHLASDIWVNKNLYA